MFTRLYVEALLNDSKLANLVWDLWDAELISDEVATIAWWSIAKKLETKLWQPLSGSILFTDKGAS